MLRKLIMSTALLGLTSSAVLADDVLLSMSWEDIVAQAKEEGSVTWYQWYFEPEFRVVVEAFEAEYGIEVSIPDVSSVDDAINKMMAEQDLETGDIDLMSFNGSSGLRLTPSDLLTGPIQPILPEGESLETFVEGADWEEYAVQFWGNQTCLAYDPDRLSADDLPDTFVEFEAWIAENPGQLGFNFENGGSGPSLIHNIARGILGVAQADTLAETPDLQPVYDWFIENEDNYILTASNADSLSRFNSGEFIMIATWEDFIAGNINRGEVSDRFECYVPEFGLNGGGNVVGVAKNAANPAAALVLASWLTSAETQTMFNTDFGTSTANGQADSSAALVPDEDRANKTVWGDPLPDTDVVPAVIENVFQR